MLSISVRAGLRVAFEFSNVVVYGDDSVYNESSDKCVHTQWYEEECRNHWKIPIGRGQVSHCLLDLNTEGRQCGGYDAKLV